MCDAQFELILSVGFCCVCVCDEEQTKLSVDAFTYDKVRHVSIA